MEITQFSQICPPTVDGLYCIISVLLSVLISLKALVSNLRSRHGMYTAVRELRVCDYVISNRMAVERKLVDGINDYSSDISNHYKVTFN